MDTELLSIKESDKWHSYLNKLPSSQRDIYFTPELYKVYENYGDGEVCCFVYKSDDELAIYPFFKNAINKNEFKTERQYYDIQGAYGYNGVVSSSYEAKFINGFYDNFISYCNDENIIVEFTRFHPIIKNHLFSKRHLETFLNRQTVILDLNRDIDQIWKDSYSSKNRNMIRKAEKNGLEVFYSSSIDDYLAFYSLYLNRMKDIGSLEYYYFNEKYIKDLKSYLGDKQNLILTKYKGEIIAAMLLINGTEYAHYHLSSTNTKYSSLASNNYVLDKAIRLAKDKGAKYFHFGGGNSANIEDPLFKFKANFSKERGDFYIGKKIHNKEIYNKVCDIWEKKYPELVNKYANFTLKYKETK